jgi:hypothetical protein
MRSTSVTQQAQLATVEGIGREIQARGERHARRKRPDPLDG